MLGRPVEQAAGGAIRDRSGDVVDAADLARVATCLGGASRLEADNGSLYASLGEHRLRLPDRPLRWPGLGRYVGRDVVLGLRPEALADTRGEPGSSIEIDVALAEPLGAETIVHFDAEGADDLKARLDGRTKVSAGERVALAVDVERLHFFDPETEAAIA